MEHASAATTETSPKAIVSVVLAVLGFLVFPLIPSIAAVIVGQHARREIAADPRLRGDGLAQAGVILGWVGIAIGIVVAMLFVFVIGSFFAIGSSGG
jgi:mannose/fructose/N-acetylgalactosamine-specific phosphotransferase system component IIC